MVNMSAKFYQEKHNSVVAIVFTSLFPYTIRYLSIVTLTSKINRVHPLTMVIISAKFDKEIHNGLVYRVHKFISIFRCDLDL